MQQRRMLQQRPQMRPRSRLSSASNVISNAAGNPGRPGNTSRLAAQTRLPPRTTKVTEKLVLLPETETAEKEEEEEKDARLDEEALRRLAEERNQDPEILRHELLSQLRLQDDFDVDNESAPLLAEEEVLRRRRLPISKAKSYAERLPKARRAEKLPRVTAYCTAQAYKMGATAAFVKEQHGARTKLYDDCLYTAYQLPLLPGRGGYHLRSSPILKGAGGKIVLDEAIERSERRDYHEEYIVDADEHSVGERPRKDAERHNIDDNGTAQDAENEILAQDPSSIDYNDNNKHKNNSLSKQLPPKLIRRIPSNVFNIAEMFIFGYGVVVFWNFTERQEKDILADLTFSSTDLKTPSVSLATQILSEEDFETEEFHFEYSSEIARPRVYNDMITLRSGDHMIKLAISHAIAQSTKLSFFEEVMTKEMIEAKDVPRRLATTGELGMRREEVFRILGRLFKSRVEVNLCTFPLNSSTFCVLVGLILLASNMLDVPNFFWESEPTLYPLYIAVREYLEIKPRIQVLNERCRVFLDLTEILSDSIADKQVSRKCIFPRSLPPPLSSWVSVSSTIIIQE